MGDCSTCTERQGYYLDAETIANQQEHIAQLEARISELSRENAELKQVPTHSDDSPRCPLRDGMTGEMDVCRSDCMWALVMTNGSIEEGFSKSIRCAVAVGARALNDRVPDNAFMTIPYMEIGEGEWT
jgi:hypothetical protein